MSIFGACMLFVCLIFVYMLIAEVFTVLFRLTGMPAEKARFQVVSMLTNSGYTTQESELVTATAKRRRLARVTMVFGYAFTVTIVSSVVNIFLAFKLSDLERIFWELPIPLVVLLGLLLLVRSRRTRSWFDDLISRTANRMMYHGAVNHVMILDYFGDMVIAQVRLHEPPPEFIGKPLADAGLKERYNVLVMLVRRAGEAPAAADGATDLRADDTLVVFGPHESIKKAFAAFDASGGDEPAQAG